LKNPERRPWFATIGLAAVATLSAAAAGAVSHPVQAADQPAATGVEGSGPFADRFPNLVLRTHEGKNVRFYDDLLKGKIVLINFFYATCKER